MKTEAIVEAQIDFDHPGHDGLAWAPGFQDVYHARDGAFAQARHVFLQGNGLPGRWQGRARFVILETGFGLGNNFLATWAAWRDDPQRCERLVFVSMEKHPPARGPGPRPCRQPGPALAAQLLAQWPPATPDLHVLDFEDGRVRLLLALGDVATWWPELSGQIDACYLDGFAPAQNPAMWDAHLLRHATRWAHRTSPPPPGASPAWCATACRAPASPWSGRPASAASATCWWRAATPAGPGPGAQHPAGPPGRPGPAAPWSSVPAWPVPPPPGPWPPRACR
jgi:tRNA 5-methylaminomethyl-2-thiouridine biosynthesis bifunctional protein